MCSANSLRCYKRASYLLLAALLTPLPGQAASPAETFLAQPKQHAKERPPSKTGLAKPGRNQAPQTLLLDVTINSRKLADIVRVEKLADDRLVLSLEAWREARLRPAGEKLALPDGGEGYALDAITGIKYKLDGGKLALDISVPVAAFEAGVLRENYGIRSNDYGSAFTAGTWRQGLSNALTGEARLELQTDRQAAGIEMAGLLGHIAVARGAAAFSNANGEQGGHYVLGLERRTQRGSGSLQWEYFDRGYTQFAALPDEIRPRDRFTAGYGMPLFWGATAGISYLSQSSWNDDDFKLASANLGVSLPWNIQLNVYASKQLDQDNGWGGGVNLVLPLGSRRSMSAGTNRDDTGRLINAVQASQPVAQGPSIGWRLRASDDPNQQLQAGGTLNSNYGQATADLNQGKDGTAVRLGATGSVGWLKGLPFATRNIGHGSFAVVKVADLKDVQVYRSNQVAATTNSKGLALVPNLLPYQKNQISIDADKLPLDVDIKGVKEQATPYARSGVLVEFPLRRSRNALVVLHRSKGIPVPAGAHVTVMPGGRKFVVAKRGQVYLTGLEKDNRLGVQWQDGRCATSVTLAADAPPEPLIGPLVCGDAPWVMFQFC